MRKILIGLGVVVVVLIVAAFIGPSLIPADRIKADIAREVEAATGRTLSIDGDLHFTLLPGPGVAASGLRLSNPDGASRPEMLRLRSATVEVALLPLLRGDVQVARVVLDAPDILLETYEDGSNNWTFVPADAPGGNATGGSGEAGAGEDGTPAIRLDDVVVRDGTLVYRTPGGEERIENIGLTLGAGSLEGPFRAKGILAVRGVSVSIEAAAGALSEGRPAPANLRASLAGVDLSYSGVISGYPGNPRLAGQIRATGGDAGALAAALAGGRAPAAFAGTPLNMDAKLTASRDAFALNDINLRLAGITATGALDAGLGDTPTANAVLNVGHVDLDQLLASAGPAPDAAKGRPAPAAENGSESAAPERGGTFTLPHGFNVNLETKIETIAYNGGVVRQALLNAQLADGTLNVSQASAQLPGGASVSLVGFAAPRGGQPAFEGQAEASADDLRALLSWLGTDVSDVPQERLRKMVGSARIDAAPDKVTITDIDVSVDVSRLRGGIAIAPRARPGFGIGLSLDKLNLDAYLPEEGQAARPTAAPGEAEPAPAPVPGGAPAGEGGGTGLAVLDRFDAIVQLKAGEVTVRGQQLRGISLDGTLQGGNLALRDLSVQSLAGARAKASGQLNDLAGTPKADLTLDVDASSLDRLVELAGAEPPFPIGRGTLTGSVRGDLENADLDLALQALDASLAAKGTVAPLAAPPRFDVTLNLAHPDAAAFVGRLRGAGGDALPGAGALNASLALDGGPAGADIDATLAVGEGRLAAKGRLENLVAGGPTGRLALEADHPDFVGLLRLFAPDYRPALAEAGAFKLSGDITLAPGSIEIAGLDGSAGPVGYKGSATVRTDGPRPAVTADLATSEIVADWFLPARSGARVTSDQAGAGAAPAGAAGQRWSRETIELAALREIDADVTLTAPSITYTDIRVDRPHLAATLNEGVLDLRQLTGEAYGGTFAMSGQLAARDVPTVRYAMKVDGADAAKFLGSRTGGERGVMSVIDLLFPVSSLELVSGTLGADLDVATRGASEYEMIASLDGTGAMRFTDAVVEGVDVCRISNRFGSLNGLEGFLGLATSTQGGQTRIADFDGRFGLARGVATLPEQTIDADCADVTFSGTTDLPRWLVDLRARAVFPEHPEFPGIVIEQKGPLDAPNTRLVNVNEINEYVAGKAAGSAVRKLLPEKQQEEAPAGPEKPAPKPEEQFRNLLDSLIKRQ